MCLITPPSAFLLDERVFMTLGILKVAAVLERAGVHVDMLDLSGVENYEEAVRDYVSQDRVSCFGLTATTPQMPAAAKICNIIRQGNPQARIILGGPHVTLVHAAYRFEKKQRPAKGSGSFSVAEKEPDPFAGRATRLCSICSRCSMCW